MTALPLVLGFRLLLAQAPSPSGQASTTPTPAPMASPARSWFDGYQPKDAFSQIVSVLALALSGYNLWRAAAQTKRKGLLDRLQSAMRDLDKASVAFTQAVEENLTGKPRLLKESHRQCQQEWRKLQQLATDLEDHVPSERDAILRALTDWHTALTGGRYPVLNKADRLSEDDPQIRAIHEAQKQWHAFLRRLEDKCLREEVKFWIRRS